MTRASRKDIKPFLEALDKGEVDTFVVSWSNPDGNRETGNSRSCMTGSLPIMVRLLGVCLDNIKYALVKQGYSELEVTLFIAKMLDQKSEMVKGLFNVKGEE